MKRLVLVLAGVLMLAAWVASAWAHGPNGNRSGYKSHNFSQPRSSRPSYRNPSPRFGHAKSSSRNRKSNRGYIPPQSKRLPRIEGGVLYSKPGPLQNRPFSSPIAKAYERGWGVSPRRKALEKKNRLQPPPHTHAPRRQFPSPDPWFLYGNGHLLR